MNLAQKVGTDLINSLEHNNQFFSCFSYATYVREFRTIGAILPRQSGKTTFLTSLHNTESSVIFIPTMCCVRDFAIDPRSVITFSGIESFTNRFRGMGGYGLKFSCFILDEFSFMTKSQTDDFYFLIEMLYGMKMLHKDFYIIKMST